MAMADEKYRTIAISPDIQRQVNVAAAITGVSIKRFAEEALKAKLATVQTIITTSTEQPEPTGK